LVLALATAEPLATSLTDAAALTEGAATTLAAACGGLDWLGLGLASRFPWQETRTSTRPAAQGTRVTERSVQAFPRIPRISGAPAGLNVSH
jgi:hypothetical protein